MNAFLSADWGPDGTIVFAGLGEHLGLWLVDDAGGEPEQIALIEGASAHVTSTGHLLFTREDSVWAVPFDDDRLEVMGDPSPVLRGVQLNSAGIGQLALGHDGALIYLPPGATGGGTVKLMSLDREGGSTPLLETPDYYSFPRYSPDGDRLAVAIGEDRLFGGPADIWLYDADGGRRSRLTFERGFASRYFPTFTPDGNQVAYAYSPVDVTDIFWTRTDGTGRGEPLLVLDDAGPLFPFSFSPDGQTRAFYENNPETGRDIWMLPMDGERTPEPFLVTSFEEQSPAFSTDGRWLAYVSNETGEVEVFITPYHGADQRYRSRSVAELNRSGHATDRSCSIGRRPS